MVKKLKLCNFFLEWFYGYFLINYFFELKYFVLNGFEILLFFYIGINFVLYMFVDFINKYICLVYEIIKLVFKKVIMWDFNDVGVKYCFDLYNWYMSWILL